MDNKTKLFVTDLSAVSLSTDYLYAKDSNIKADVKVDPVDNGGEKIATITVNGVATEISAKTNYTAFEVFPTNVDIPAGTIDEDTNLEYKVTVPSCDTAYIYLYNLIHNDKSNR